MVVRLLDGFDFVVSRSPDGVEIMRVAPRGTASFTPQARPGATEWKIPSAQAPRRQRRRTTAPLARAVVLPIPISGTAVSSDGLRASSAPVARSSQNPGA